MKGGRLFIGPDAMASADFEVDPTILFGALRDRQRSCAVAD
jgi:hypothetical protein